MAEFRDFASPGNGVGVELNLNLSGLANLFGLVNLDDAAFVHRQNHGAKANPAKSVHDLLEELALGARQGQGCVFN